MALELASEHTVSWLADGDTSLMDGPNEDGMKERDYWMIDGDTVFYARPEVMPDYDPFERDQTYKED